MPATLKVNGRDISAFLRMQPDDGLDPVNSDFLTPQFGGAPALSEGGVFVADSTRNKEWTVPMWVRSATGAQGVQDLVGQINLDMRKQAVAGVEFKPEGATSSTFFDLERGQLNPKFSQPHLRRGWVGAELKLWTRPFGHIGSMRTIVPSQSSTHFAGPGVWALPSIAGDAPALGNLYMQTPNSFATGVLMYGITSLPSYNPVFPAASLGGNIANASLHTGNNIGLASRHMAWPIVANGTAVTFSGIQLAPETHCGRNRIFGWFGHSMGGATSNASMGVNVWLTDPAGNRTTLATALVSINQASNFGLVDLGEIIVPSQVLRSARVPTSSFFQLNAQHSFPSRVATLSLRCAGLMAIPLDYSAGIIPPTTNAAAAINYAFRSWPVRECFSNSLVTPGDVFGFGASGLVSRDLMGQLRGEPPKLPIATQAKLITWGGNYATYGWSIPVGTHAVQFDILERFKFFR